MSLVINLLIWVHILAFIAGGSNSVAGPVIGRRVRTATPEQREAYYGVVNALAQAGKVAMVVLLVTGPLILWLKYGGVGGASVWFWVKMALIVVMLAGIIVAGINEKRGQAGDAAAAQRAERMHMVTGAAGLGVILAAVLAFN